jgi:expansin (peptidoglycan-binding protein)
MRASWLVIALIGCGPQPNNPTTGDGGAPMGGGERTFGDAHSGQYNLGPVEWEGSFHNACAPYPPAIEMQAGELLAGVDNMYGASGDLCDACILIQTAAGKSLVERVVTYGVSNASGDLDLSSAAYNQLTLGEYPRTMTWQLATCPDTGMIEYQFQTQANPYWTSLWVRNARVPIMQVEVMSANHASWFALTRGSDGTLTDAGGFGSGGFMVRVTSLDGQQVTDTFPGFNAGDVLTSAAQFH